MNLRESFRISWRSIAGHKLRSTLTTLGVIIGIASVITFMILGGAFTDDILGDVGEENAPVMQVQTQTSPEAGTGIMIVDSPIYTETDIETIESMDDIAYVAPLGDLSAVQLTRGDDRVTGGFTAIATSGERFEDDDLYTLTEGKTFTGGDEAVVNTGAAQLFEENVTTGDELTVALEDGSRTTVTVVGVVDEDLTGQPVQPAVYLPLESHYNVTVETPRGTTERAYPTLEVRASGLETVDPVQDDVVEYFESDSDARELKNDGDRIEVQTIQDAIDQVTGIIDQLTVFIGGIAAISLVVGSIGIANIMIVSVTERTREIGIMKAVGARKRDIVQLFLVESVILGAVGAVFGVALGVGVGYLAVSALGWPMVYPLEWIAIAVAVGVGVGVLSGLYPAWRAARVDPIEALRRE
ncbi:ABC transporter permease [Natronosalvus halobius]|uniref:ABC transporter permease n=1 Tax=Natronosalvus halobius TaxID=2953746 RepID=UPI00209F2F14|nr:ABC transporter permease [Natronosalvus halobius]USZ71699.1 ABC transporter permease [Natronosalvus halobius]